jgi:GNAT superfamily N-acetyltransferase
MIGRLRQYARTHGVRATLVQIPRRLAKGVFASERLTVMSKDLDAIVEPRKTTGVRVEEVDPSHLDGLAELNRKRGRKTVDRRFRRNLERGLHGCVGLIDEEVVAYYWWVEAERAESHPDLAWLGTGVQIGPGDVYGSDFYVLPEHRAGGMGNEVLFQIECLLRERGFKRVWGYVDTGNREARWLYSARGYQPMKELTSRRVLSRRRIAPVG